jgi:N-methylhydantoinase A
MVVGGKSVEASVVDRGDLRPGDHLSGPAIVQQFDTTTFVAVGWSARVDEAANLILERISVGEDS